MEAITDNDLALFRERAKTELKSTGDIGRLAWDDVVEALCKEVARLRSVSKERGDAAKLREALDNLRAELWNNTVIAGKRKYNLYEIADAALSAPSRNCDAGTPEEQLKRKRAYCKAQDCRICPFYGNDPLLCAFRWAQTTYKEGVKDENE